MNIIITVPAYAPMEMGKSGTGHWLQLNKPEEYNQIMDEFLSSIDCVPPQLLYN